MADTCTHVDEVEIDTPATGTGCEECLAMGAHWLHLRRCMRCGHIGCCDSSPNKHASKHSRAVGHALVQSFEPGEDWYWCFVDDLAFEVDGHTDSPSHP